MKEELRLRPPTTPEEEKEVILDRSEYLLKHIAKQDEHSAHQKEQHGIEPLTGALRPEVLKQELDRLLPMIRGEIKEQRKGVESPEGASLIFIDLDNFKQVNDTHGHSVGDKVLKIVSECLKDALREKDLLARYGGDEFVVLLPNTDEKGSVITAEKLRMALDNNHELKDFGVTASFGVCSSVVSTATDSETFIKHSDEAAYVAKRAGGNRVEVYK